MPLLRPLGFTLVTILASSPALLPAQSVADLVALGDKEHAEFRPAKALEHYEAALALDSLNPGALGRASRSAVDLGEHETTRSAATALFRKGERYARRAVAANPNDAESLFHLARALGRTALSVGVRDRVRYAVEIRETAHRALALDPKHPGALHVIGMWNAEVMRLNGVERFFAKNFLGGKVFGQASWKDAVSYMERAVEVDPERLTHHLDLAKVYVDVKETAKAREQFQFVVDGKQTDVNDPVYKREAAAAIAKLK
jgi:tetratricopeptide (TPR) repeat protein